MAEIAPKKTYELTVIISSDLSEFDAGKAIDKIKSSITGKGGEIIKASDWGKRQLAYVIKGNEYGFYHTLVFNLPPEAVASLTRELELSPETLRYVLISLEKEGVAIEQLFSPEKEALMISSTVREKLAPAGAAPPPPRSPARTSGSENLKVRRRVSGLGERKPPKVEPIISPEPKTTISQEELDQKIEEALKSDLK